MIPIRPELPEDSQLFVIAEHQPEYYPLPVRMTEDGELYTVWQFTAEEKDLIADGKPLHLRILTFGAGMQPIALVIEGSPEWDNFYDQ